MSYFNLYSHTKIINDEKRAATQAYLQEISILRFQIHKRVSGVDLIFDPEKNALMTDLGSMNHPIIKFVPREQRWLGVIVGASFKAEHIGCVFQGKAILDPTRVKEIISEAEFNCLREILRATGREVQSINWA